MRDRLVRIIGIDPGLRRTGWGVIETDGVRLTYVSSGLITSTADEALAYRLRELFEALSSVIAASGASEAAHPAAGSSGPHHGIGLVGEGQTPPPGDLA